MRACRDIIGINGPRARLLLGSYGVLLALVLAGCAHPRASGDAAADLRAGAPPAAARRLQEQLLALGPTVSEAEAWRAAVCAFETSEELAREYRMVRPPHCHNLLVNLGLKKRGLCYHWAEDLLARLQVLNLETLEWHWGIARAGTPREHNCVVVTAKGQPFADGLVLDAWRRAGRLYWAPVAADRYPWEPGEWTPAQEAAER